MSDPSPKGYEITIPRDLAEELRHKVRTGQMTVNEFDHRIAETGHTLSRHAIQFLFLFATFLTDDF